MYFSLCGVFGLLGSLIGAWALTQVPGSLSSPIPWPVYLVLAVSGGLSLFYLRVGLSLERLLATRPNLPLRLGLLGLGWSLVQLNVLGILLNLYICYQLKRLAKEASLQPQGRTLS